MKISVLINLLCIVVGGAVALYAQAEERQNIYLLIGGIVMLMIGIYRISRNIPSKHQREEATSILSEQIDLNDNQEGNENRG
jgi:uncharacterized membrane protein YqgA involved in biofilm formation